MIYFIYQVVLPAFVIAAICGVLGIVAWILIKLDK